MPGNGTISWRLSMEEPPQENNGVWKDPWDQLCQMNPLSVSEEACLTPPLSPTVPHCKPTSKHPWQACKGFNLFSSLHIFPT